MANSKHAKRYSDEEQSEFCQLAQTIGIGRAIRELGYPSYPTAMGWMHSRNLEPNIENLLEVARKYHTFYETQDYLVIVDNAMAAVESLYVTVTTADDAKKLAEAIQKLTNTRLLLEGKSTNISEKRETTQQDLEIAELLRQEQAKNPSVSEEAFVNENPSV